MINKNCKRERKDEKIHLHYFYAGTLFLHMKIVWYRKKKPNYLTSVSVSTRKLSSFSALHDSLLMIKRINSWLRELYHSRFVKRLNLNIIINLLLYTTIIVSNIAKGKQSVLDKHNKNNNHRKELMLNNKFHSCIFYNNLL